MTILVCFELFGRYLDPVQIQIKSKKLSTVNTCSVRIVPQIASVVVGYLSNLETKRLFVETYYYMAWIFRSSTNSKQGKKNFKIHLSQGTSMNHNHWCPYCSLTWAISSSELFWSPVVRCLFVCPSVNFSHFHLLLKNHWAIFNQTWHKESLGEGDSNMFKSTATSFSKGR